MQDAKCRMQRPTGYESSSPWGGAVGGGLVMVTVAGRLFIPPEGEGDADLEEAV